MCLTNDDIRTSTKRILVYGDSNSFGWAWSPEKDIYRLPIDRIWPQVMAQKLGPDYEVEVNALGGRTVKRDQKDGNGTDKSLSGKLFNGMVSLPAVLSENLPLDLVIVMLGTNDANSRLSCPRKSSYVPVCQLVKGIYLFK